MSSNHPARFHLTLTSDGRAAMHGWWGSETVARGKMTSWIGRWGRPGAHIAFVDEETGTEMERWPKET